MCLPCSPCWIMALIKYVLDRRGCKFSLVTTVLHVLPVFSAFLCWAACNVAAGCWGHLLRVSKGWGSYYWLRPFSHLLIIKAAFPVDRPQWLSPDSSSLLPALGSSVCQVKPALDAVLLCPAWPPPLHFLRSSPTSQPKNFPFEQCCGTDSCQGRGWGASKRLWCLCLWGTARFPHFLSKCI